MARIRSVKPELWTDGDVMDLSPFARLLFVGSWNFAMCDFGHVADDARRLKMQVLPGDDTMMVRRDGEWVLLPLDPTELVDELIATGRMTRLEVDGRTFLHVTRFTDHQKTERRWTPRCPACRALDPTGPLETSTNLPETPRTSAPERKGRDRRGKAAAAGAATPPPPVDNALPGELTILRGQLEAHNLIVRWDKLTPEHLTEMVELVQKHGDAPLVRAARNSYQPNNPPQFAQAWLGDWRAMPDPEKQRLALVKRICPEHGTQLSPAGVCPGCAIEAKVGDR